MTTSAALQPRTVTAAILELGQPEKDTVAVTYRTGMSAASPSGRGTAYIPAVSTEGAAIAATLARRVSHNQVRTRNTVLTLATGLTADGNTIDIIKDVR